MCWMRTLAIDVAVLIFRCAEWSLQTFWKRLKTLVRQPVWDELRKNSKGLKSIYAGTLKPSVKTDKRLTLSQELLRLQRDVTSSPTSRKKQGKEVCVVTA